MTKVTTWLKEGLVTRFVGRDLILEDGRLVREDLWVRNGRILDPLHLFYEEKKKADVVVDCSGFILSPGFIDIQHFISAFDSIIIPQSVSSTVHHDQSIYLIFL